MAQLTDLQLKASMLAGDPLLKSALDNLIDSKVSVSSAILSQLGINIAGAGYNAVGDGATGNYAALLAANNALVALGGGTIFVPVTAAGGAYRIESNLAFSDLVQLHFEKGASLVPDTSITVSNISLNAPPLSKIFGGSGTVQLSKANGDLFPQWWGAVGDGIVDCTNAVNATITCANAFTVTSGGNVTHGKTIRFIAGMYLVTAQLTTPASGTLFLGENWVYGDSSNSASTIKSTVTGATKFIDISSRDSVAFEKLTLLGTKDTNPANHCIFATSCSKLRVVECNIVGWGGSAVRFNTGNDNYVRSLQTTNCMLGWATVAEVTGVIHAGGGEFIMDGAANNINGPFGIGLDSANIAPSGHYTSGYVAGVYINAANFRCYNTVAAFCEVGWHIGPSVGTTNSFMIQCRADSCQGHGYWIEGGLVKFTDCTTNQCGLAADATYSGFYTFKGATGFATGNDFIGCQTNALGTYFSNTNHLLHAFTDSNTGAGNVLSNTNRYVNCRAVGLATQVVTISSLSVTVNVGRKFNILGACIPIIEEMNYEQAAVVNTDPSPDTATFDGEGGKVWKVSIASGAATELDTQNLLPGQIYTLYLVQHATPGTVTLGTAFGKKATFTSPAASKVQTTQWYSNGTTLVQVNLGSGDM